MESYMVVIARRNGPYLVHTFTTLKAAQKAFKEHVQPNNQHSLNQDVWLNQIMVAFHHKKRG